VLVVGFGNSGGEIALDLAEAASMSPSRFAARFNCCPATFWACRS
jgi:hypothetical protein